MKIILLRGLGREAAHWEDFPNLLTQALMPLKNYTVMCIDLPGCGAFYKQSACNTIAEITEHAHRYFQQHNCNSNEKAIIIGLSMGGMVALNWAQKHPETIAGIVLINSSFGTSPLFWRFKLTALPKALCALFLPMIYREKLILECVSNTQDKSAFNKHLNLWCSIQKIRPVKIGNVIKMLLCAARFKPSEQCGVPGLIIASENDRLVSVKCSDTIAKQYRWPIQRHPSAGHDLPLDAPQWLCEVIEKWLIDRSIEIRTQTDISGL